MRWADQYVDALLDGEAITMNDGGHDFLGILTESAEPGKSAAIVLHGMGAHPDWPQIISPMRVYLAETGWTTLSLQLPILANEATEEEYRAVIPQASPRIKAGITLLRQAGYKDIVIVAHSLGCPMAAYALTNGAEGVRGFVAIGMSDSTLKYLGKINIPLLDIFGSEDLGHVVNTASKRKDAASSNSGYSQQVVAGADHFFANQEDELIEVVREWINNLR